MILFFLLTLQFASAALPPPYPEDLPHITYFRNPYYLAEGFKLGFIVDFHRNGLLVWSYEGAMMQGYATARQDYYDPYCLEDEAAWIATIKDPKKHQTAEEKAKGYCFIFSNPWMFSSMHYSAYEQYSKIDNVNVTPVLLYYVRPLISFEHAITETKNFAEGFYPVRPDMEIEESYSIPGYKIPIAGTLNVKRGFTDGRIVSASLDHVFRKSFEIVVQEGPAGGNLRKMSVSDQHVFDFIVKAMLSGKLVRVDYIELTGIENAILQIGKDYDTPYRVTGVQVHKNASDTGLSSQKPAK